MAKTFKVYYRFYATVERWLDADTVELMIDQGFNDFTKQKIRLFGIDAPEISTAAGKAAKAYALKLLPPGTAVKVETQKLRNDPHDRWSGKVYFGPEDTNLSDHLLEKGLATPYKGT